MSDNITSIKKVSKWKSENAKKQEPALIPAVAGQELTAHPPIPEYFLLDEDGLEVKDGRRRIHIMVDKDGVKVFPIIWSGCSPANAALYMMQAASDMVLEALNGVYKENEDLRKQVDGLNQTLVMAMAKRTIDKAQ